MKMHHWCLVDFGCTEDPGTKMLLARSTSVTSDRPSRLAFLYRTCIIYPTSTHILYCCYMQLSYQVMRFWRTFLVCFFKKKYNSNLEKNISRKSRWNDVCFWWSLPNQPEWFRRIIGRIEVRLITTNQSLADPTELAAPGCFSSNRWLPNIPNGRASLTKKTSLWTKTKT